MKKRIYQKNVLTTIVLFLIMGFSNYAQRPMEKIDRGLVVQERSGGGVYLTWRMLGTDSRDVAFNLYRDDVKINDNPIDGATNYIDEEGSINSNYKLETILENSENEITNKAVVFPLSDVPDRARIPLKRIPLDRPVVEGEDYSPGNMSTGDLTGDGSYELVLEWESTSGKNSILDAIDLDGNLLWRIHAGPNTNANKLNFMVYDLNQDGTAEVAFMTGPGTIDGLGQYISKGPAADYPHDHVIERGYGDNLLDDPQFITIFDGQSGREMATTEHWPPIGPRSTHEATWGDDRGHRASSLKGGVIYTQEHGPLLVFQRGVYTRVAMAAHKWDGADGLEMVWQFDSYDEGNEAYNFQANHTVSIGDVDGDGNDEYITGPAAFDEDGSPMWTTGFGHGDANHLGDHIPDRPGLEFFMPHEDNVHGLSMVDAATGEVIWEYGSGADVGRAWAADVDPNRRGSEVVAIGFPNYDCNGNEISTNYNAYNQPVYFDETEQRDWRTQGWGLESYAHGRILTGWHYGASPIHGSKDDANLVADILGDWREEVIYRDGNNEELIIFTSWMPTERKNPTLMHDPTYRMNIVTQNVGYNQSAHTGYYFRDGYPDHDISLVNRDLGAMSYGNYYIQAEHSSLMMDAANGVTQQANDESANQVWEISREGDALSIYSHGANQYLSFETAETGTEVVLTDEASKQLFQLEKNGENDLYYLVPEADTSLTIAVNNGSENEGATLVLTEKTDVTHQKFKLINAGNKLDCNGDWDGEAYLDNCGICVEGETGKYPNAENLPEGYYKIKPVDSDSCLEIDDSIYARTCSDSGSQEWEILHDEKYFTINSTDPVRYLRYIDNTLYLPNIESTTPFRIEEVIAEGADTSYIMTTQEADWILGFAENGQDSETALELLSRSESGNQKFILEKLPVDKYDCNGEWNGTAYIDDCGRCVEGNTGEIPCADLTADQYHIKALHSGLCLEPGSSDVAQQNCDNSLSKLWKMIKQDDGSYKIQNKETEEYIAVSSVAEGEPLFMSSSSSTNFNIVGPVDNNQTYIISPADNMDLSFDVYEISENPGAHIVLWSFWDSDNQKFTLEPASITGINNRENSGDEMVIHPNPVQDLLNISLSQPANENARWEIYNLSGKIIEAGDINEKNSSVSVGHLNSGAYLIRILNGEETSVFKINVK